MFGVSEVGLEDGLLHDDGVGALEELKQGSSGPGASPNHAFSLQKEILPRGPGPISGSSAPLPPATPGYPRNVLEESPEENLSKLTPQY